MIKDKSPQYLHGISINDVFWKSDIMRICDFCGSIKVDKLQCPNCGNTTSAGKEKIDLGQAIIVYKGLLPMILDIFELPPSVAFDLVHGDWGDPAYYWDSEVIMRFSKLKIISRTIPQPMALCADELSPLIMYINMTGNVDVLPGHFMSFEEHRAYITSLDSQMETDE